MIYFFQEVTKNLSFLFSYNNSMSIETPQEKAVQKNILDQIGTATEEELREIHKNVMWYILGNEPDPDTKVSTDEKIQAINRREKELGIKF